MFDCYFRSRNITDNYSNQINNHVKDQRYLLNWFYFWFIIFLSFLSLYSCFSLTLSLFLSLSLSLPSFSIFFFSLYISNIPCCLLSSYPEMLISFFNQKWTFQKQQKRKIIFNAIIFLAFWSALTPTAKYFSSSITLPRKEEK